MNENRFKDIEQIFNYCDPSIEKLDMMINMSLSELKKWSESAREIVKFQESFISNSNFLLERESEICNDSLPLSRDEIESINTIISLEKEFCNQMKENRARFLNEIKLIFETVNIENE